MVRRSKDTVWGIIVAALIVLGFAQIIMSGRWSGFLIPVIVLGTIFLLYKFPPGRARSYKAGSPKAKQQGRPLRNAAKPRSRTKNAPFKVIEGGKDDDQFPRYH